MHAIYSLYTIVLLVNLSFYENVKFCELRYNIMIHVHVHVHVHICMYMYV